MLVSHTYTGHWIVLDGQDSVEDIFFEECPGVMNEHVPTGADVHRTPLIGFVQQERRLQLL